MRVQAERLDLTYLLTSGELVRYVENDYSHSKQQQCNLSLSITHYEMLSLLGKKSPAE